MANILIIQTRPGIGDLCIFLSSMHQIAKKNENSNIFLLTKKRTQAKSILKDDNYIKNIFFIDRDEKNSKHSGIMGFFKLANELKKFNFDKLESLINEFLTKLNIKKIDNLFLHNPKNWEREEIKNLISKTIKNNFISKFGLSIYETNDIYKDPRINILQIPANIFNQSIIKSEEIQLFSQNGGEIHVRSVFLQGLLLMDDLHPVDV